MILIMSLMMIMLFSHLFTGVNRIHIFATCLLDSQMVKISIMDQQRHGILVIALQASKTKFLQVHAIIIIKIGMFFKEASS